MTDTKIKIWLSVFVFSLMFTGGFATYLSQKNTFYKGLEPLGAAKASVLNISDTEMRRARLPHDEGENFAAGALKILDELEEQTRSPETLPKPQEVMNEAPSRCPASQILIIKNGKFDGCSVNEAPQAPGPKVTIVDTQ